MKLYIFFEKTTARTGRNIFWNRVYSVCWKPGKNLSRGLNDQIVNKSFQLFREIFQRDIKHVEFPLKHFRFLNTKKANKSENSLVQVTLNTAQKKPIENKKLWEKSVLKNHNLYNSRNWIDVKRHPKGRKIEASAKMFFN